MRSYSLESVSKAALLRDVVTHFGRAHEATAVGIAYLAEIDSRRAYLEAAHPSLRSFCLHVLHLSEDSASKRIQAARTARRFPEIFEALAANRLHLSGVILLAPYLTEQNAGELLAAAEHKTKAEIELLLARRFPRSEDLGLVEVLPAGRREVEHAPAHVVAAAGSAERGHEHAPGHAGPSAKPAEHAPGHARFSAKPGHELAPAHARVRERRSRVTPVADQRYGLHLTIGQTTYDKLRYAKALLSHAVPDGDLAEVVDRALDALVRALEKRKLARVDRPRTVRRTTADARSIPARVRRAVWERDGDQCSYVGEDGQRCPARDLLELDHVVPVARGGQATVDNLRVRCRGHNALEANRIFGAGFMEERRAQGRDEDRSVVRDAFSRGPDSRLAGAPVETSSDTSTMSEQEALNVLIGRDPIMRELGAKDDLEGSQARIAAAIAIWQRPEEATAAPSLESPRHPSAPSSADRRGVQLPR
jgi:5-methylcytosine-specific restriction endonuclease McrA